MEGVVGLLIWFDVELERRQVAPIIIIIFKETLNARCLYPPVTVLQTEDCFWVVVLTRAPAHVWLSSTPALSGSTGANDASSIQADAHHSSRWHGIPAGLSKLKHPLAVGGSMYVRLLRDGKTVIDLDASREEVPFVFEAEPETYSTRHKSCRSDGELSGDIFRKPDICTLI